MSEPNRPEGEGHQDQGPQGPPTPWDAPREPSPAEPGLAPEEAAPAQEADSPSSEAPGSEAPAQEPPAPPQSAWDQQRAGWGEQPSQAQQPQPWGEQPTQVQPQQQWGQPPSAGSAQQPPQQPQQPWGEQPTQVQPQQQWGQPPQQWGPPQSAGSAQQAPQQWGQPAAGAGAAAWGQQHASSAGSAQQWGQPSQPQQGYAPYGGAGYGAPTGQPPYGGAPEKKSLAWLWVTLGGLVALAAVYFLVAFLMKLPPFTPSLQSLVDECEAGSAQACEDLFQRADEGSPAEDFGRTCGGRSDGFTDCNQVDMTLPANSWVEAAPEPEPTAPAEPTTPTDPGTQEPGVEGTVPDSINYGDNAYLDGLYDECAAGNMEQCDRLYFSSLYDSEYEAFALTCGGTNSDQFGTCSGTVFGAAANVGDDSVLDGLATSCQEGDMEACDDLFDLVETHGEYLDIASSCGYVESVDYGYYCNPNHVPDLQLN